MNENALRSELIARGLPAHVAEGFVMNFRDESGLDPGINEIAPLVPGSRGGYGLAQWTGPRRNALEAFAADRGVPVSDAGAQLDFLMSELSGPEKSAMSRIMATNDPGSAASAIATYFLRPAKSNLDRRVAEYQGGTYTPEGWEPEPSNALRDFNPNIPLRDPIPMNALRQEAPRLPGFVIPNIANFG